MEYLVLLSHSMFPTFMKHMAHSIISSPPKHVKVHRLKAAKPDDYVLETLKLRMNLSNSYVVISDILL